MERVTPAALSLEGLSKVFQGQRALDRVELELRSGEIHALLGQNGSGKSTLIKILAGYHSPESGATAEINGAPFELGSPTGAREAGLRFIHQDLGLVGDLDVVDNLALGNRYAGSLWLSDRRERRHTRELLSRYGIEIDPAASLDSLTPAQRSMLAIIRALNSGLGDDGILVLDEPTAALPGQEVHQLFDLVRAVRDRGVTVLYVTHRLTEVFELCDRVTVLRDGRNVATRETAELDHDGLVELIVGRPLEAFYPPPPPTREDVVLEVEGLCGETVDDVSLRIHEGEIVGVTGLVGSGSEHLLGLIFGGESPDHGEVRLHGEPIQTGRPSASVARGIAFASADRKRLGGMLDWTLRENVTLPRIGSRGALRWLGTRAEQKDAGPWLDRLDVVPPDPERSFFSLSGGNQQKVVLARWLRCQAQVLLLDEPTNGIDMGSKHSIYETLATVAADGAAVLLSSSDAEELCAICDRVLVMRDGRVAAQIERDGLSVETLLAEGMRRDDVEDQDKEEVKR